MQSLTFAFDYGFPYAGTGSDARLLPRLPVFVSLAQAAGQLVGIRPLIDTGADRSIFDGSLALEVGWDERDIVDRASDALPVVGVGQATSPLIAYRHSVSILIPLGRQFAALTLPVFLTPPGTLTMPGLGRRDFLRQVDLALVEAEQRFYLRFRDRTALRTAW